MWQDGYALTLSSRPYSSAQGGKAQVTFIESLVQLEAAIDRKGYAF